MIVPEVVAEGQDVTDLTVGYGFLYTTGEICRIVWIVVLPGDRRVAFQGPTDAHSVLHVVFRGLHAENSGEGERRTKEFLHGVVS